MWCTGMKCMFVGRGDLKGGGPADRLLQDGQRVLTVASVNSRRKLTDWDFFKHPDCLDLPLLTFEEVQTPHDSDGACACAFRKLCDPPEELSEEDVDLPLTGVPVFEVG